MTSQVRQTCPRPGTQAGLPPLSTSAGASVSAADTKASGVSWGLDEMSPSDSIEPRAGGGMGGSQWSSGMNLKTVAIGGPGTCASDGKKGLT